jgi:C4-dicarboxylate transporter DctM subunit
MGGIYTGIFTPTEAAAMSAVYAFIVCGVHLQGSGLKDVPKVLLNSANMSAMLLYIITNAVLFSFIMTNENIPQALADWMLGNGLGVITFLLAVNVILLLAGNFMEPSSIVLIFAPILFPVAMALGIDPVHFGIMMVVNMEVGMCHPPVGLNLYVASGITKMGITELTVAVWPWLLSMLGFLVVVTYWPDLSLWLPRTAKLVNLTQPEYLSTLVVSFPTGEQRFVPISRNGSRLSSPNCSSRWNNSWPRSNSSARYSAATTPRIS